MEAVRCHGKICKEFQQQNSYSLLIFLTFLFFVLSFIIFGTLYKSIKHSILRERCNAQENLEYDLEMQESMREHHNNRI